MTVVNPKSISGINSITTGSGSDDILTIHNNNGTERLRVDSTGATKIVTGIVTTLTATSSAKVGSGVTLSSDGDIFATGVCTATSFVGSGANLTGISGVSVANQSDNRVITNTGTTDALNAEAALTFDGTNFNFSRQDAGDARMYIYGGEGGDARLLLASDEGDDHIDTWEIRAQASDNNLAIYQFAGGSYNKRLTIDTDANNGDVIVNTGNVVIGTSGKGIDFSATSDAGGAASELLDDYEEGTWTPTFSSSGATFAYNHQYGYYQKVGNTVHVSFYITLGTGDVPITGSTGNSLVIDLPFQATNSTRYEAAVCFSMVYKFNMYTTGSSDDIPLTGRVYQNETKIDLLAQLDDAAGYAYTGVKVNMPGCGLAGSVTYRVA